MRNDFRYHPVYKTLPLARIYALSAGYMLGRMLTRRDRPAPRMLRL